MPESRAASGMVSVVIPTYYRNERLEATLQSVYSQSYEPLEVVVVDDSGEAHARPVVAAFDSVEYVPLETNQGPQAARTAGIERASGEFVQLLDDDDELLEGKLRRQVELLNGRDDVGVAYCGFTWDDGTTVLPRRSASGDVLKLTLTFDTAPCTTSTMLTKRSVLEQCLPLADRPGADDVGLKIELAKRTKFEYVDEALVLRNRSSDSRQASAGKVEGQKQILAEYRDLYDQFPPAVYRTALAETYLIEGLARLEDQVWSPSAISDLAKACYYMPGLPLPVVGAFAASLLGRPGRDAGLRVLSVLRGSDHRGKSF